MEVIFKGERRIISGVTPGFFRHVSDEAMKLLRGDACSIYVRSEKDPNLFIILESLPFSEYQVIQEIDIKVGTEKLKKDGNEGIGITFSCIYEAKKDPLIINDVREDVRWNGYKNEDLDQYSFGLPPKTAGPLIVVCLFDEQDKVLAVIRVVRRRVEGNNNFFNEDDKNNLKEFALELSKQLSHAIYLNELIDIGSTLDLKEFCQKVVITTKRLVKGAKACSIFISKNDKSSKRNLFFGLSSTGTFKTKNGDIISNEIAWNNGFYEVDFGSAYSNSITEWVLKCGNALVIDDLYSLDELEKIERLNRSTGRGLFSEVNERDLSKQSGSAVYLPVLSRDENRTLGVLRILKERITKPGKNENINKFSKFEVETLLSYQKKLSQIISNISFINLLDRIRVVKIEEDKLELVANEIVDIVGGRGCSIFLFNPQKKNLEFKATAGSLKGKQLKSYEIGAGYTGWVAKHKKAFWFNKEGEFRFFDKNEDIKDKPHWSGRTNECEAGSRTAEKFAGIPILTESMNLLGVIRVAKVEDDTDFTLSDIDILVHTSKVLSKEIEESRFRAVHLRLLDAPILPMGEKNIEKILFCFMTFISHEDGLGFNRVLFFKNDENQKVLKGQIGIGPKNKIHANDLRKMMEYFKISLVDCIAKYSDEKGLPNEPLQDAVSSFQIKTDYRKCALAQAVKKKDISVVHRDQVLGDNRAVVDELEIEKHLIVYPIYIDNSKLYGMLLIDNIYAPEQPVNTNSQDFLRLIVNRLIVALEMSILDSMGKYNFPIHVKDLLIYLDLFRRFISGLSGG